MESKEIENKEEDKKLMGELPEYFNNSY